MSILKAEKAQAAEYLITNSSKNSNRKVDLPAFRRRKLAQSRNNRGACAHSRHFTYAFTMPWISVTTVSLFATANQADCSSLPQVFLPGLMAGLTGMALYKATKAALSGLRRAKANIQQQQQTLSKVIGLDASV